MTEQCILCSALDAHIRHFNVVVASDAVAHLDADLADAALRMMRRNMSAEINAASDGTFDAQPPQCKQPQRGSGTAAVSVSGARSTVWRGGYPAAMPGPGSRVSSRW